MIASLNSLFSTFSITMIALLAPSARTVSSAQPLYHAGFSSDPLYSSAPVHDFSSSIPVNRAAHSSSSPVSRAAQQLFRSVQVTRAAHQLSIFVPGGTDVLIRHENFSNLLYFNRSYRSQSQLSLELCILKIGPVSLVRFSKFKVLQKAGTEIY